MHRPLTLGAILVLIALSTTACGASTPALPTPPSTDALPGRLYPTQPSPISEPPTEYRRPAGASPATTLPVVQPTVESSPTPKVAYATTPVATPTVPKPPSPTAPPVPKAPTGRIAYSLVTGDAPKFHTIWVARADGSGARQVLTHAYWPAFSPDGARLAYYGRPEGGSEGLYVANADGGNSVLAVVGAGVCCLKWSRDGNWIVYAVSNKPNQPGGPIAMVKADGFYKTIVNIGVSGNGPAFSPDGKHIVYAGCLPNTNTCGLLVVPAGGGAPRLVTRDNGGNAHWSPDGSQIVYQARDDAGHIAVFVVKPDGSGKKQLTTGKSNDGQPVWSRDGGSIFWRSDQNGTAWGIFVMNADGSKARRLLNNVPPDRDLWGWESLSVAP